MSQAPLVSTIIIFLNAERFLAEAIESVFAQTYSSWELLLVDDGSTDGSTAIALDYAEKHPDRVRYLEHPGHANRGMSATRNLGIRHAAGVYIAFLDADDVWLPEKLAHQVRILESHPEAAMVYGPTEWWYSWTGSHADTGRDYVHHLGVPKHTLVMPPELLLRFLEDEGISPCTCSVLLRRVAVAQIGGFEEQFRGMYEDQAFFAKLALHAPIYVDSQCLARYRQHLDSSCSTIQQQGSLQDARTAFLRWLQGYLNSHAIDNRELHQTIHAALHPRSGLVTTLTDLRRRLGAIYGTIGSLVAGWPRLPLLRQLRAAQLRRLQPLSAGRQRGTPVVRYYWAQFLQRHRRDIQGDVLEIGGNETIRAYGGAALRRADALDLQAHSPEITVVADLSRADHLPAESYDCFVNQFTMHLIYDAEAALFHAIRILKPGGVLLVNFPCVDYYFPHGLDMGTGASFFLYWWYTPIQVENLLRQVGLGADDYELTVYGNLFARVAYQMNMPAEELTRRELAYCDPGHPLLICVRVTRPQHWIAPQPLYREPWQPAVAPARWNSLTGHYGS